MYCMDNKQKHIPLLQKEACILLLELPLVIWICVIEQVREKVGRGERIVREKEKHHEYEFNSIWGKELLNDHSEQMVAFFFVFLNTMAVTQIYYSPFEQKYQWRC